MFSSHTAVLRPLHSRHWPPRQRAASEPQMNLVVQFLDTQMGIDALTVAETSARKSRTMQHASFLREIIISCHKKSLWVPFSRNCDIWDGSRKLTPNRSFLFSEREMSTPPTQLRCLSQGFLAPTLFPSQNLHLLHFPWDAVAATSQIEFNIHGPESLHRANIQTCIVAIFLFDREQYCLGQANGCGV